MICISLTSGEPYNLDIATSITQPYHIQLSITSGNMWTMPGFSRFG